MPRKRSVRLRKTQTALRLLILILIAYGSAMLWSVSASLAEARQLLEIRQETARTLREENAQMARRVNEIGEEEKWERIARQQLGLVSPDETVIYYVGD